MEPLTEKQRKVLHFIEAQLQADGPPSQREIARHFGMSQNSAYQLVGYLKKKGYLQDVGGHRGLRLSQDYLTVSGADGGVPIVGRVAAGEPILAQENIEGYIKFKELFGPDQEVFFLKVQGDSMIDEGIMDGDYVAVRPGMAVENGQLAVVLLDDEATVKRVYIQRGRIALKPANSRAGYKTRYIRESEKDTRIVGKVTGCVRTGIK